MPYRALEAIHSDVYPGGKTFEGKLVNETDPSGNFIVKGKGGIFTDEEAEKFGVTKSPLVEKVDLDQIKREHEERNAATHKRDAVGVRVVPPALSSQEESPKADAGKSDSAEGDSANVIEVTNSITESAGSKDSEFIGAPTEPTDALKAERKADAERKAQADAEAEKADVGKAQNVLTTKGTVKAAPKTASKSAAGKDTSKSRK